MSRELEAAVEAAAEKQIDEKEAGFCNCSNPLSKAAGGCPTHDPGRYHTYPTYQRQVETAKRKMRPLIEAARPHLVKAEREQMAREILLDLVSHNEYGECRMAPRLVTKLRAEFPHLAEFPSRSDLAVVNNTTEGETE